MTTIGYATKTATNSYTATISTKDFIQIDFKLRRANYHYDKNSTQMDIVTEEGTWLGFADYYTCDNTGEEMIRLKFEHDDFLEAFGPVFPEIILSKNLDVNETPSFRVIGS